jgi:hypothetical protein
LLQIRAWVDHDREHQDPPGEHRDQEHHDREHQDLPGERLAREAEHRVQAERQRLERRARSQGLDLQLVDQAQPAVVAAERAPQEHLVEAGPEENPVSQREQSVKNLNKGMFLAWAAQWCLVAMEALCCEFVEDLRSKTSQTRSVLILPS